MKKKFKLMIILMASLLLLIIKCNTEEEFVLAGLYILNEDGAWCWFQDERALIYNNKLAVASIKANGDNQITTFNLDSGNLTNFILNTGFEADDHNLPGLLLREDGHLMAFYTRHNLDNIMRYRVSSFPYDTQHWDEEQSFSVGIEDHFTYANPYQLTAENNRIYMFFRALNYNPTFTSSDDNGNTWAQGKNIILYQTGERPYVKYCSNGVDTIHFAFTEAHPRESNLNSLYHMYYKAGNLYKSDGTLIKGLSEVPVNPTEATQVYDGVNSPTGEAWVWDMELDPNGNPVIVYASFNAIDDHRYRYARWNSQTLSWEDYEIAYAGTYLYIIESQYSGGICLDPDNTQVVYLSSDVNIETGQPNESGHYEIYRGTTLDYGQSWVWEPITQNSQEDNLRPIVPKNHFNHPLVLWFRGEYTTFNSYRTQVVLYAE